MYTIKAEVGKNYLYIRLRGYLAEEEIATASQKALLEAQKLSHGFTIVNDIGDYKPASKAGADIIAKAQRKLFENGATQVIRIVGENVLGKCQWRRTSREGGAGFDVFEVGSVAEAKRLLGSNELTQNRQMSAQRH